MKMKEFSSFNDFVFESLQINFDVGITDHPFKFFERSFHKILNCLKRIEIVCHQKFSSNNSATISDSQIVKLFHHNHQIQKNLFDFHEKSSQPEIFLKMCMKRM